MHFFYNKFCKRLQNAVLWVHFVRCFQIGEGGWGEVLEKVLRCILFH